jgi:Na+-transporting methylmalonyl-CoA/oxaloacetate decarboxylase gamma subunit
MKSIRIALLALVGIIIMNVPLVLNLLFDMGLLINILVAGICVVSYILLIVFFLRFRRKVVVRTVVRTVERPVYHEVEKPVYIDREIEVEKPVYIDREVVKPIQIPIEKTVYITPPEKKKLVIPKYDYVGSEETMTYHTRNCRFGKLIKRKHKVSNNSEKFFTKKGFKPCKICLGE